MRIKIAVLFVFTIALILRLWQLGSMPPGLTWDEAALGYNAYSLYQTAKDEYGNFLPLNLVSFGDYKPALYAYMTIPFVAIFGLNEWAVRLPSALLGSATVVLVYLLTLTLFRNRTLAILSGFFVAISPLSIHFSRMGFESNVAVFLNTLGLYLFIKGLNRKIFLTLSMLMFGLSLLTYQGSRLFVPILILFLWIFYLGNFRRIFKNYLPLLVFFIFISITLLTIIGGQNKRLAVMNFFAYQRSQELIETISNEDGLRVDMTTFQILHGEWWAYTRGLVERYLIYFSPKMLFIDGDYNERHRVPDLGVFYFFSSILIPLGTFLYIRKYQRSSLVIFLWLIIAPLPAVLSRDLINMVRALNMYIPFGMLEAGGLYYIILFLKRTHKKFQYLCLPIIGFIILVNLLIYIDRYFLHMPREYSQYYLYGYRELIQNLPDLSKYDKVIFTDYYGQPYIYYLFFSKYSPENFQLQAKLDQPTLDVGTVRKIDKIDFRKVYWPNDRGEISTLTIGTPEELPEKDILPFPQYKILKEVKFLNGEVAFRIVESI